MTEAGWTREKPTVAGFWWWRQHDRVKHPYIVEVDSEMNVWFHGKEEESRVDYLTGEWLGPLSPDDKAQGRVEGLREAAGMVDDDCYIDGGELLPDFEHRCKHNVNQKELAGKIRFRANALAQAAQDEKGVGDAGR